MSTNYIDFRLAVTKANFVHGDITYPMDIPYLNFHKDGTISLEGSDDNGEFNFTGHINEPFLFLKKQYVGKHAVFYVGKLDNTKLNLYFSFTEDHEEGKNALNNGQANGMMEFCPQSFQEYCQELQNQITDNGFDSMYPSFEELSIKPIPAPSGKMAIFNKYHNRYLSGTHTGCAEQKEIRSAGELFNIEYLDAGKVAIKSCYGFYLSAQPKGSLEFNRTNLDIWEIFEMKGDEKGFSLLGHHGKYVCFEAGGLFGGRRVTCNRAKPRAWEIFEFRDQQPIQEMAKIEVNSHRVKVVKNKEYLGGQDMNKVYLSATFNSMIEDFKKIVIKCHTKDQGWASVNDSASWFDLRIVNPDGVILAQKDRIITNLKVKEYEKKKFVVERNDDELGFHMSGGNRLELVARSQYPGWEIHVKQASIKFHD